ncbi:NUMOD4 domain-containing protein [Clostridium butyricum]|uniref:NUMOD4 domain-containing protein n=1 Tax=Clostridium butyricum TaxID=1492 RepID=UPI00374ED922
MTNEIWKDIAGYEGLYQVSNLGRVKSLPREKWNGKSFQKLNEKILKVVVNKSGYVQVALCKKSKYKNLYVHRLVARAFIDNPENKKEVDHINTIRNDNRVENLRWVTPKENNNNELTIVNRGKKVVCITTGIKFNSIREASEFYSCDNSDIAKCCKNKKNYAGKYNGQKLEWKYLN